MDVAETVAELIRTFKRKRDKGLTRRTADELATIVVIANPTVQSFFNFLSRFNEYIEFTEPIPVTLVHIGHSAGDIAVHREQLNVTTIRCSGPDGCKSKIELIHEPAKRPRDVCLVAYDTLTIIYYDKNLTMCRRRKGARNVLLKHIDDTFFYVECEAINYFVLIDFIARNIDALEEATKRSIETTKKTIKDIVESLSAV